MRQFCHIDVTSQVMFVPNVKILLTIATYNTFVRYGTARQMSNLLE